MTPTEASQHLVDAGFTGWTVVTMGAIAIPESTNPAQRGFVNEHSMHLVKSNPESRAYLSVDWGAWGINDYWWEASLRSAGILVPGLPVSMQLLQPAICAKAARHVFVEAGGLDDAHEGYDQWVTWRKDLHLPFMCDAEQAAREVGAL